MAADFKEILNGFHTEVEKIEKDSFSIIDCASKIINLSHTILTKLRQEIRIQGFESYNAEVSFFKTTKQIPLVPLIYYSEIRSFELQFPKISSSCQRKYIKKKMEKLNRFFLYNIDFGRYINSDSNHFDKEYYTRDCLDTFHITTSKFYFQDPEFCTPRDMLLGKYKAYNSLIIYLDNKKQSLKRGTNGTALNTLSKEKLNWPFSNTDYVELLYALCSKGLGSQDKHSIMQVSKKLQQIFDFEPKDIYKTFQDIKNRKNSRTIFLDQLSISLISQINKSEE